MSIKMLILRQLNDPDEKVNTKKRRRVRMKKGLFLLMAALSMVCLFGCSEKKNEAGVTAAESTQGEKTEETQGHKTAFPNRKIEIVVGFGPGSGTDITARAIAEPLSDVLGVPVVVTNIEGSQGLNGLNYIYKQPNDGYTLFLTTQTQLITQVYGLSEIKFMDEFEPVARLCHDVTLLGASSSGRFKNLDELMEFAKANPKAVKIAGLAATGLDGMIIKQFVENSGMDLDLVSFGGTADCLSALLGNHVDLSICEVATAKSLMEAGDMIGMMVLSENRLDDFPDIPCSVELGIDATIGAWRGLSVKKGTDPEVTTVLENAVKEAMESEKWKNFVETNMLNYRDGYADADGFRAIWEEEYAFFESMAE